MNIIKVFESGALFGEIALLMSGRRTASVIAKTECTMILLSKHSFDKVVGEATF